MQKPTTSQSIGSRKLEDAHPQKKKIYYITYSQGSWIIVKDVLEKQQELKVVDDSKENNIFRKKKKNDTPMNSKGL